MENHNSHPVCEHGSNAMLRDFQIAVLQCCQSGKALQIKLGIGFKFNENFELILGRKRRLQISSLKS